MASTFPEHTHSLVLLIFISIIAPYLCVVEAQQKNDANYFEQYDLQIRKELETFTESQLVTDVKLTRIRDAKGGLSIFFPYGKVVAQSQLFSWKSKNESVSDDIIVIGANEKLPSGQTAPPAWMSATFVALKKANASTFTSSNITVNHYYALVAYIRKDFPGNTNIELEWDRWTPRIMKNFFHRDNEGEAAAGETLNFDTLLCLHGTCSCAACGQCRSSQTDDGYKVDNKERADESISVRHDTDLNNVGKSGQPSSKGNRTQHGMVSSLATSKNKNAYTTAVSHRDGETRAAAEAQKGVAVAEADTKQGPQSLAAARGNTAFAEAKSGGTGDAMSLAVASGGPAQSSAQSRGGFMEAKAIQVQGGAVSANPKLKYADIDDEISDDDPLKLVRDANRAFLEAFVRSQQAKLVKKASAAQDLCVKEYSTENNIMTAEMSSKKGKASQSEESSLLNYGIDFDIQINSTVLISSTIPGHIIPRKSCCEMDRTSTSAFFGFLKSLKQECIGDLGTQAQRLQSLDLNAYLTNLMKVRKLSMEQYQDLFPLILMRVFGDSMTKESIQKVTQAFQEPVSNEVNLLVALAINSAHFGSNEGFPHKVKIWKALTANMKTVWTGILLETKRCKAGPERCSDNYVESLKSEARLVLGVYMFLKYSEVRWSNSKGLPVEAFLDFYTKHTTSLSKVAFCKTRRVVLNAEAQDYNYRPPSNRKQ